jgi:hypothetical protein
MAEISPRELRLALKAHGHSPIPLSGKRPLIDAWPTKLDATDDEIAHWSGNNTGILCERTSAFDIDILHEDAVAAVEDLAREWLDDRGTVLVRFGQAPKCAIPFRPSTPFSKFVIHLTDPRTKARHKIEVLGEGQQFVVAGTHPDTHQPYRWHGNYTPWTVHRDDLPELTEANAQDFVEACAELLAHEFGFVRELGNGAAAEAAPDAPLDIAEALAEMRLGGGAKGIHHTQVRAAASLLRSGCAVEDVVDTLLEETRRAVAGEPSAASWIWDDEQRSIERMSIGSASYFNFRSGTKQTCSMR